MTPHKFTTEPIVETSETESFSSEQSKRKAEGSGQTSPEMDPQDDISLDALFGELSKETKKNLGQVLEEDESEDEEESSEFSKIKKSIEALPKIESNLEKNIQDQVQNQKAKKKDVVRINDPIVAKVKVNKDEPTDAGAKWYNMKQPEMTPELKRDLLIIKHRSALDPKRHYKKDKWEVPKYFQVGTIIEGNTEFYSGRMNRRDRGNTLVEEVLKDDETNKYFKRKYSEIQDSKRSGKKGYYKKVLEKRRKF
ncbi:Fcf2-domain-containing protein [Suhomyces tanzawaensis NRRL Y-17324]|uniref:Fcf2-domain-containing protein n=1 Tax=Suhomyces tanzawaensis NRRL Y-17324 TaxID=984487 RepID=A0A1E4SMT3_9ASCO|nr:Fcf2-domain-containing protein [Suhomyces tanzawaensis NRRL Y-17324]ODV80727.1 Fcf2-domain-containing protein [Suhomyces tanzawaensis NRRL Y-17324]